MRVNFFDEDHEDEFFDAMNALYPFGKRCVYGADGEVSYVSAKDAKTRLGYYVKGDGFYLILSEKHTDESP